MRPKESLQTALHISLVDREVVFLGDGAVNFSMTQEAARATLRSLADTLAVLARSDEAASEASPLVVLLVEDEPLIRELSAAVPLAAGFTVIEAEGADEAMVALEANTNIHILFTDVHMPGALDGFELARLVERRWPAIGLLIASGHAYPEHGDMPAKGRFLGKPYAMTDMLMHVLELAAAA